VRISRRRDVFAFRNPFFIDPISITLSNSRKSRTSRMEGALACELLLLWKKNLGISFYGFNKPVQGDPFGDGPSSGTR
jgi:hypothetical protein